MAVSLSEKKIKAYRISFAELNGPEAFKKALDLVEQLSALNPLLTEMHRRELVESLGRAITTSNLEPSNPARRTGKAIAAGTTPKAKASAMVQCPQCNSSVRADRLDRHLRKIHQTASATSRPQSASRKSAVTREKAKQQLARMRQRAKSTVVCGDCDRSMTREDYAVHICKVRGRGWEVQGGAPGLRRR